MIIIEKFRPKISAKIKISAESETEGQISVDPCSKDNEFSINHYNILSYGRSKVKIPF